MKNPLLTVVHQRLADALWQRLRNFGKLILIEIALVVLLGHLLHSFLVLQCFIVVVDPYDPIKGMGQHPVERRSQPLRFLLESVDRRSDLEIAGAAALDRHSQSPILKRGSEALPLDDITHLQVILDIALKEIPAILTDPTHDGVLREDDGVFVALPPRLWCPKAFPHQGGAQIVDQFGLEFVPVCGRQTFERW